MIENLDSTWKLQFQNCDRGGTNADMQSGVSVCKLKILGLD